MAAGPGGAGLSRRTVVRGAGGVAFVGASLAALKLPFFEVSGAQQDPATCKAEDISATDKQQPPDSGVIDHIAFGSLGFEVMKQHLTGKGIRYRVNQVPSSTRWQIFFRDPNNVEIELNFETKNETAFER